MNRTLSVDPAAFYYEHGQIAVLAPMYKNESISAKLQN